MEWNLKPKAPGAFLKHFSNVPRLIAQLLYNRGLANREEADAFFNSDYKTGLHNPFLLKGMRPAVRRIMKAIQNKERITVYGDFDADGVCATAILLLALREAGAKNIDTYIPDRASEGHGLNESAVRLLGDKGAQLIVTVDCGSADLKEIELASSLGIDVIVTDHHQLRDNLPGAIIINPWQKGDKYPFKDLAGAGVTYKLACALLRERRGALGDASQKWLLDLAAIATVADVMPLTGENRVIVRYGLSVLAQTRRIGLKKLMEIAGVNPQIIRSSTGGSAPLTSLDVRTIGFVIGPRLNAAGRMGHADTALSLLTTQDELEANRLAGELNRKNTERQNMTERIVRAIQKKVDRRLLQNENPQIIFEGSPDWPVGLIGLAAGKIADYYRRPAVIYQEKDGLARASCRSVPRFNLMEMLGGCADVFVDFGGHKGSAGFKLPLDKVGEVKDIFSKMAAQKLSDENSLPVLDIDAELSMGDMSWGNYNLVQQFTPFGCGNPEPVFMARQLEICGSRTVGNDGRHLKLELAMFNGDNSRAQRVKGIGFGMGSRQTALCRERLIDVAFQLSANEWNGYRDLEMKVLDFKSSADCSKLTIESF